MKVFVTGGSGFLGQTVIRRLRAKGHSVLALARSPQAAQTVTAAGATAIAGDLFNPQSFSDALKSVEAVIHCAAPVKFWGEWSEFETGTLVATLNLARTASNCGVKRFVTISSESVLQDKGSLLDIDESFPYPKRPNSFYGRAKMLAEQALLAESFPMAVVILRPTFIWGPGSAGLATICEKAKGGQFVWVDHGRAEFEAVHVENIAEAACLAVTAGKDKGVYFITDGEPTTVREFFDSVFDARKIAKPTRSMPFWLARGLAIALESLWKFGRLRSAPPLTRFDLAFVSMPRRYDISKAKTELGYRPIVSRRDGFQALSSPRE